MISGWSSATLQIVQIDRFPPAVERAIVRVADTHPELKSSGISWVNLGPRGLIDFGLRAMSPSGEELRFAIDWVITIPDSNHQLRAELREFLQELGHEDLAYYIA